MAEWVCRKCGWKNAGKWNRCAKCGEERLMAVNYEELGGFKDEITSLVAEIDQENCAAAPKWEYLQLTSEALEEEGGLSRLGQNGWELVGTSTYSEGGTVLLVGPQIYTIKALYVFKRPYVPFSDDLRQRLESLYHRLPEKFRSQLPPMR